MSQAKPGRSGAQKEPKLEPEREPEHEPEREPEPGPGPESASDGSADPGQGRGRGHGHECLEWCPVCRSTELLKGVTSPELRHQLQAIQNEAAQVLKAFAAAYTERAGGAGSPGPGTDPFSQNGTGAARPSGAGKPDDPDEPVVTDISIE